NQIFSAGKFTIEMQKRISGSADERPDDLHCVARRVVESVWLRPWNGTSRREVGVGAIAAAADTLKFCNKVARPAVHCLSGKRAGQRAIRRLNLLHDRVAAGK